jgi:exopolyphosphatase/guanosine-5'-triphosphate,3'-diphosphate pyrophosphatase
LKERLKIKGLEKKRADIIPAGLIILRKIFQLYDIECMTVSEYALRSGIIIEMLKRQASYNG